MNDDEKLLLLLQMIRVNGNTEYLLRYDYTLTSLADAINGLQEGGMINITAQSLELTQRGEELFRGLCLKLHKRGVYRYFNVNSISRTTPVSCDAVYVPYKVIKRRTENRNTDI